jgi:hypothetical protein
MRTGRIQQASVGRKGPRSGGGSHASVSNDGRLVAFQSWSSDIVANDTNNTGDVFVRDLRTGTSVRVSVNSKGQQSDPPPPPPRPPYGSDRYSSEPAISGNGEVVAFTSRATNFVAGDTNASSDVFVHYLRTGVTAMVSVKPDGSPGGPGYHGGGSSAPSISQNGRIVAFRAIGGGLVTPPVTHMSDSYVRDLRTGVTQLAEVTLDRSLPANGAFQASISQDGRYVAFSSSDANVVAGDRNGISDVFVRDLLRNRTRLASLSAQGTPSDKVSSSGVAANQGRAVAFETEAALVPGDTNAVSDVFLHRF